MPEYCAGPCEIIYLVTKSSSLSSYKMFHFNMFNIV